MAGNLIPKLLCQYKLQEIGCHGSPTKYKIEGIAIIFVHGTHQKYKPVMAMNVT
jgi:hypothetical protein